MTNTQSLYSSQGVTQVNIPAATGDMGILANHVPSVEALKAGVVEVIEDAGSQSKKWFSKFSLAWVRGPERSFVRDKLFVECGRKGRNAVG
jgi:F-type H+-transporting ATPase subunit delta